MAKTAAKRRRKQQRSQEQAERARHEWEQRMLEAAQATLPARSRHAKLLLPLFLLGFTAVMLAGVLYAPGTVGESGEVSVWLALITGLTAGGLSCLAVQGGLLATAIAQREKLDLEEIEEQAPQLSAAMSSQQLHHGVTPVISFLVAKLVVYTLLGLGLGWLGSQLKLTPGAQAVVQVATALFMVATALHLLKVHPIFRYVIIQPPRFITRRIRSRAKSRDIFAPAILGAMTVFMPCAVTQVMQLAAINSASPLDGAAIMFAFVLGSSPLFLGLGLVATKLGDALHERFLKVAAVAVLAMAAFTLDAGLRLAGSPASFSKAAATIVASTRPVPATPAADGVQEVRVKVESRSYNPGKVSIKAGEPARIVFEGTGSQGCTSALVWQGTVHSLPLTGDKAFDIAPREKGQDLEYSCAMGMYGGTIKVV